MTKKGDSKAHSPPVKTLQLKVTLKQIQPPIWRRIVVANDYSLGDLHWVIQKAMGWGNCHMHSFRLAGIDYVPGEALDYSPDENALCDEEAFLNQLIQRRGQRFAYEYDFGDCWKHDILVEKAEPVANKPPKPHCLDGARACPPEDCGGPGGYQAFLEAKREPAKHNLEYWGEPTWVLAFDPERFDLEAANRRLNPTPP